MMFGSRRSKGDDKGGTRRRMWGAPRKEKFVQMLATDGLLLAHHEEGHRRICEEMPQLPSTSQLYSHSPIELTQHGHPIALPHLGA